MINWEGSYHQERTERQNYPIFAKLLRDKTEWIGTESQF